MIFRKSITARFIATVCLVLLIAQSAGSVAFIFYTRNSLFNNLRNTMERHAAIMACMSANSLLSLDYTQIDGFMSEVAKDEEIISIRILDSQGKVIRERITAGDVDPATWNPFFYRKSLSVAVPVISGSSKIGDVTIHFSARTINENISKNFLVIMIYQGIVLLILGVIMAFFFDRHIRRPVSVINKALEKMTTGDLSVELPDFGENELGLIAKGVTFLEQRLSLMISKIN
jgi:methyl-accepting chemotaxis protein